MSNVNTFFFNSSTIRVVTIEGQPWFVAADVCRVLGIGNTTNAVRPLHDDEKRLHRIKGMRGSAPTVVNESGLYKLILRSDKPAARAFQDWVTRDVLPAIRKDGGYIMGEEKVSTGEMSEDELILKAVEVFQSKVAQGKQLRQQFARNRACSGLEAWT
ncbi:BRO-N domain-containing protein [Rhodovulum adriaticum]|uniref:Prophage antirepressor-like protein n=1 Tax=Rhodovulum adriaticum TaxID=35804 RepID=A0A4R2NEW3_RHOAD|nr:Bro-N domain-containing protein [Rhodovulum adriaticum]MBK1637274.1 BRO domain-containing protein [Rhodovulum adriaticum]TCP19770.1 prophage antirepressor-like protein [Rhodovulum adriaticum]